MNTILVVDDDPDMRALLRHKLARAGYDVILAEDGESAERAVRSRGADLILVDINMPGVSGDELVASLREDAQLRPIPVVYLTGVAPDKDLAVKTVGYPILAKPVSDQDLLATISSGLKGKG